MKVIDLRFEKGGSTGRPKFKTWKGKPDIISILKSGFCKGLVFHSEDGVCVKSRIVCLEMILTSPFWGKRSCIFSEIGS